MRRCQRRLVRSDLLIHLDGSMAAATRKKGLKDIPAQSLLSPSLSFSLLLSPSLSFSLLLLLLLSLSFSFSFSLSSFPSFLVSSSLPLLLLFLSSSPLFSHLEFCQRDVTDGMRSPWKIPVELTSRILPRKKDLGDNRNRQGYIIRHRWTCFPRGVMRTIALNKCVSLVHTQTVGQDGKEN